VQKDLRADPSTFFTETICSATICSADTSCNAFGCETGQQAAAIEAACLRT